MLHCPINNTTKLSGVTTISSSTSPSHFSLTTLIENPFDLLTHLPFRIAVVSNLLALNRDWPIRDLCQLEPRELRVLINIGSYMPIKSADIAYQTRMDSYTVSRAVKKLLSLDYAISRPDTNKRNVKNLELTQTGIQLYKAVTEVLDDRNRQLESVLSDNERYLLFDILARLETKSEAMLAEHAIQALAKNQSLPADQKELIRWYKKSQA